MSQTVNWLYTADSTTPTPSYGGFHNIDGPVVFKNLGPSTVYLAAVLASSPGIVSSSTGFPVAEGETVYIPSDDVGSSYFWGFNTASGTATVVALGKVA